MEKHMERIFKHLPLVLFSLLFVKILWLGAPTAWETVALLGTGVIAFAHQYYSNNNSIKELKKDITSLQTIYERKFEDQEKINKDTISSVASVKIGAGMTQRRAN